MGPFVRFSRGKTFRRIKRNAVLAKTPMRRFARRLQVASIAPVHGLHFDVHLRCLLVLDELAHHFLTALKPTDGVGEETAQPVGLLAFGVRKVLHPHLEVVAVGVHSAKGALFSRDRFFRGGEISNGFLCFSGKIAQTDDDPL